MEQRAASECRDWRKVSGAVSMFAATPATATGKPRLISHTVFMTITEEAAIDATLSTRFYVFWFKNDARC